MADFATVPGTPQAQAPIRLACRLRPQEVRGARGPLQGMGELELENLSPGAVEIRYQMSPLQYLELAVTGPSGAVVSEGHFGDRFSPMAAEQVLQLQPGEKFRGQVALLATVPRQKRSPGLYRVQAVYEYNGIRAISDPVPLTVP